MAGRSVIRYEGGRFGVFEPDSTGGQSLISTFDSLAAAFAVHPHAVPDADAWRAMRPAVAAPATGWMAVWVGGATLGIGVVLDIIGMSQRDPVGRFYGNASFQFWLAGAGVMAAGGIVGLILARRSRGVARAWALGLNVLCLSFAPFHLVLMVLLAYGQGMAVG